MKPITSIKIDKEYLDWIAELSQRYRQSQIKVNTPLDNPAIGLLICKEKNSVLAKYALSKINSPIGISEYSTSNQSIPKEYQETLPSPEEISKKLSGFNKV